MKEQVAIHYIAVANSIMQKNQKQNESVSNRQNKQQKTTQHVHG